MPTVCFYKIGKISIEFGTIYITYTVLMCCKTLLRNNMNFYQMTYELNCIFMFSNFRQHLAVLHFNENSHRRAGTSTDGGTAIQVTYPKYKADNEFSIKIRREKMTFGYVVALLQDVMQKTERKEKAMAYSLLNTPAPPPLCSNKRRPCREEIVTTLTRYKKLKFGENRPNDFD